MTLPPQTDLAALYELYLEFEHQRLSQRVSPRTYASWEFDPSMIDIMTRDEFSEYFRRLAPPAQRFQIERWQAGFEHAQPDESLHPVPIM
jgi:hypothetical protein